MSKYDQLYKKIEGFYTGFRTNFIEYKKNDSMIEGLLLQRNGLRDEVGELFQSLSTNESIPHDAKTFINNFIDMTSNKLTDKPYARYYFGVFIKALLELSRYHTLHSTSDKKWWTVKMEKLTFLLRKM